MLDAMSIGQHVDYNWRTGAHSGYVDLGQGAEEEEAKEALVFMLVGLNGGWKAPIAYYLTKGLTADSQKELVHWFGSIFRHFIFLFTILESQLEPSMVPLTHTALGVQQLSREPVTSHPVYMT